MSDGTRPAISDGKTNRAIWRPEDGHGDPSVLLFERSRYTVGGHPTWKLYCGDAPEKIDGVLIEPPRNCYLDDRAAYKILHWDGFTKANRGRLWRNDFTTNGALRPGRKNRGRPAFFQSGEVAFVQFASKKYRFHGAENPHDNDIINREIAAQKAGCIEIMDSSTPQQPEQK
jgi:hypothetical protein